MKRTLYILTRFFVRRNSGDDEFIKEWSFPPGDEEKIFELEDRKLVIIHGYIKRIGNIHNKEILLKRLKEITSEYTTVDDEDCGFLCHPNDPNLYLFPYFNDFVFAKTYSVGVPRGDWPRICKFKNEISGIRKDKVTNPSSFIKVFDEIWNHFLPDISLRKRIEAKHREIVSKQNVPSSIKVTKQTEHYLLIWNTISSNDFAGLLTAYLATKHKKTVQITIVTNHQQFKEIQWSKNWKKVFVLAELNWTENDFEGIPLVFNILQNCSEENVLELLICSVMERDELLNYCQDRNILIMRSFPFLFLSKSPVLSLLEKIYVSPRKWRYKLAELLDERELIGTWLHDLKYIKVESPDFRKQALRFCENLLSLRSKLSSEILNTAKEVQQLLKKSTKYDIKNLESCLQSIQIELDKLNQSLLRIASPVKRQARVMIVDDDFECLNNLQILFEPWFSEVVTYRSGSNALTDLKNNVYSYDALVVDLELMQGIYEDLIQGTDLIDYCERFARWIAVRVVTGLPRNSIPKRLSDFSNDRIILKQRKALNEDEPHFVLPHFDENNFMSALSREIDQLERLFKKTNRTGPSEGIFAAPKKNKDSPDLTNVYYELKITRPKNFNVKINEVNEITKNFLINPKMFPINTEFTRPANKLRASWEPYLWDLLKHRLVSITLQMKKGSIIYCDFREELGLCYDLGRPIPSGRKKAVSAVRGWFTTRLGFSISKKLLKEDCIKVELNDNEEELFPHEIEWKQNIDVEDFIWIRDKFRPSSCEEIISTIDEISDVLEPNQNERPVELMKNFTNRTSFSDLHIIMDFLFENPHNRKVANLVRSLIQIMENGAIDEIPKWLEDMME